MKVLIKQANIICPTSSFHRQVKDILLVDGQIQSIEDSITELADQVIAAENLHVSIGWMDVFSHFGEPGYEHKETLLSGAAAAAAGGFTDVMVLPNTSPSVSNKSMVEYLRQKSVALPVSIHPIGSITKNAEGKELTEMYDMFASGAIAFSDGNQSVQSAGVLLKALQYVLPLNATIIQVPDDKSISAHGLMNEGIVSTQLGLAGKNAMAEELMITRDIELVKFTQSKLHITGVSTKKGLDLIAAAKKEGVAVTCSVSPAHLFFCDQDLVSYDSQLKLNPPLRTSADRLAIRQALNEGLIDCLASHHTPQHWDDKTCEFEYAKYGTISLEALFGVTNSVHSDLELLIQQLTASPRHIFGLAMPEIKEGADVCLTLFNPEMTYHFEEKQMKSLSKNCAFLGKMLKGKVLGIIHHNIISLNES
jgi:dihydroorotase